MSPEVRDFALYAIRRMTEDAENMRRFLGSEGARDYAHYKYCCGLIRGLEQACAALGDLSKRVSEDTDDESS